MMKLPQLLLLLLLCQRGHGTVVDGLVRGVELGDDGGRHGRHVRRKGGYRAVAAGAGVDGAATASPALEGGRASQGHSLVVAEEPAALLLHVLGDVGRRELRHVRGLVVVRGHVAVALEVEPTAAGRGPRVGPPGNTLTGSHCLSITRYRSPLMYFLSKNYCSDLFAHS